MARESVGSADCRGVRPGEFSGNPGPRVAAIEYCSGGPIGTCVFSCCSTKVPARGIGAGARHYQTTAGHTGCIMARIMDLGWLARAERIVTRLLGRYGNSGRVCPMDFARLDPEILLRCVRIP